MSIFSVFIFSRFWISDCWDMLELFKIPFQPYQGTVIVMNIWRAGQIRDGSCFLKIPYIDGIELQA